MDFVKVKSLEQATTYLESFVIKNISDISQWTIRLKEKSSSALAAISASTTADEVEEVVTNLIQQLFAQLQKETADNLDIDFWYTCIECCVTAQLHDAIFGALCAHLEPHDSLLRQRCLDNGSCLISNESAAVPLTAAVVELSNLDAHTNALEKFACLCTAHDLVYAELKAALIELQVERDSDCLGSGIVVVERDEVVALLSAVMVRSKPPHMYTNLYYIQAFGAHLFDTHIPRQIYEDFSAAVELLVAKTTSTTHVRQIDHSRHLDLSEIVEMAATDTHSESGSHSTLQSNQRKRLLNLITTATTQHHQNI